MVEAPELRCRARHACAGGDSSCTRMSLWLGGLRAISFEGTTVVMEPHIKRQREISFHSSTLTNKNKAYQMKKQIKAINNQNECHFYIMNH